MLMLNASTLNALSKMAGPFPHLFGHFTKNCRSNVDKTRKYSKEDAEVIRAETQRLLLEDIIESISSPRQAQVFDVQSVKRRLTIEYSQTLNCFLYSVGC